jgi:hypothetical protein
MKSGNAILPITHLKYYIFILTTLTLFACSGGGGSSTETQPPPTPQPLTATVLAYNDLGMHCMDREFSVFSILPPFNVLNAQVVLRDSQGNPSLADETDVDVLFNSIQDASGSKNSYSYSAGSEKTDFWVHANSLFGTTLQPGQGLTGLYMPEDHPTQPGPQTMAYKVTHGWFSAEGIPITPMDDSLDVNPYPLLRVEARNGSTGALIETIDAVVPVASETDCQTCHITGGIAADDPAITWSVLPDPEKQSKVNILLLHDSKQGTDLASSQPVLCAACHYSKALDLSGTGPAGAQVDKPYFSKVMDEYHGSLMDGGLPVFPPNGTIEQNCYQCHPGQQTQCQRGAMKTGGMDCFDCHGNMAAVGGSREPWTDLPACQSCHTGDAVSHLSGPGMVPDALGIRLRQAFLTGDATASPIDAVNKRFAENNGVLYRRSKGHSGIACEACHGSTHAEWPNADAAANDNVTAQQLQGHAGTIIECSACHGSGSLDLTVGGPHGLHNVNDNRWADGNHEEFYVDDESHCKACHGTELTGTVLSRTAAARSFEVEEESVSFVKGEKVRCDKCHDMP